MPSGAKKRKAAKRKEQGQEQEKQQQQQGPHPSGIPASTTTGLLHPSQGNGEREEADDDLVSQDGKGSQSGGNFASPTARENHHHHHIGVEEEEEEEQIRAKVEAEGEEKKGKKESDCAGLVDTVNVMEGAVNAGSEQPSQSLPPQKTEDEVAKKTEEEVPVVVVEVKNDDVPPPPPSDPVPPTAPAEVPVSSLEAVSVEHVQSEKGEDGAVSGDIPQSIECKESDAVETADPVELSVPIIEEVAQTSDLPVESVNLVKSAVEVPSEKNEEKVVPLSQASGEQPDLSSKSQPDIENRKTAETTEVVPSTQLERWTSWMNCCGLVDIVAGAHR